MEFDTTRCISRNELIVDCSELICTFYIQRFNLSSVLCETESDYKKQSLIIHSRKHVSIFSS